MFTTWVTVLQTACFNHLHTDAYGGRPRRPPFSYVSTIPGAHPACTVPHIPAASKCILPISVLLGLFCGKMLNMAKGREMVTSYIISFFMNGLYQLVVLYMMGSIIPIIHSSIKLPRGYGVRNTVSLLHMRQYLDNFLAIHIGGVKIPVLTLIIIALLCLFIIWFRKTKLGQDMRAVGQDMDVAGDAGIKVERTRIIAIIMSTVFAGLGMVIYLQNMGNISTYSSHMGMMMKAAHGSLLKGILHTHQILTVSQNPPDNPRPRLNRLRVLMKHPSFIQHVTVSFRHSPQSSAVYSPLYQAGGAAASPRFYVSEFF